MLLLIAYKIEGTIKRSDERRVVHEKSCFAIGHFPLARTTVANSLTSSIISTITVGGIGKCPPL